MEVTVKEQSGAFLATAVIGVCVFVCAGLLTMFFSEIGHASMDAARFTGFEIWISTLVGAICIHVTGRSLSRLT